MNRHLARAVPDSSLEPARSGVSSQGNQAAELTSMWIAPEVRGNGDGRGLVEAVQGWVRDNDLQPLQLDVFEKKRGADAFYTGIGFVGRGPSIEVGERTMIKSVEREGWCGISIHAWQSP